MDEVILVATIGGAFALLLFSHLTPDLVALLVLLVLGVTGVVSPETALAGFASPIVITILGLFIITEALEETGLVGLLAQHLNRVGRGSEGRLVAVMMLAAAFLSLFMNNVAAGAVLLPAAVQVGQLSKVRLSKLLIPLSYGTLVGGMATYFTTANIVMSNLLKTAGQEGLSMLDFVPTGGLVVLGTLGFMLLVGRHWLPERQGVTQASPNLYHTYQLEERLWEGQITSKSPLAGQTLGQSGIGKLWGVTVLAIWRLKRVVNYPMPEEPLYAGDTLLILGRQERVDPLQEWGVNIQANTRSVSQLHEYAEVVIPPRSVMIGKTLKEVHFRNKYNLSAVALWREGNSYRTDVGNFALKVGDALLVIGKHDDLQRLGQERDFLVLAEAIPTVTPLKARRALLIALVVVVAAFLEVFSLPLIMLGGSAAMVLAGCLNMDEAYRAVEWRVIFLIAGMLPISAAMLETGLAGRIGKALLDILQPWGAFGFLAGVFLVTMLVTQVISSQITALVFGPVAISTALQMGINPQATAIVVAIATSTAFLTPIAHPVNVLMMRPAGYQFNDFAKVGLGMTITTFLMLMAGLWLFWGVR